ncbi:MAG: hypothetical protein KIS66_01790 [Fimbriimonadaceae bacterium]|nr:hypothetical protein [Fimbriimonadaceae bacterium]
MVLPALIGLGLAFAQAADGFMTRQGPGVDRAGLVFPSGLWDQVRRHTGHADRPLGYTYEQMLGYPPFEFRLRTVENLFRDVRDPAELGGLIGDNLLAKAGEPAQVAYMLWSQLDARAGREWKTPTAANDWGVPWIPKGTPPTRALSLALSGPAQPPLGLEPATLKALGKAGEAVVRLVARLAIAGHEAAPYLRAASPEVFWFAGRPPSRRAYYDLLVSPYLGDVNDDTILVADRRAYDAMRNWDANYSAVGSALFLRHYESALAEFRAAKSRNLDARFDRVAIETPLGRVELAGAGVDEHGTGGFLTLDLGGNDRYAGLIGSPLDRQRAISVVLDLGGDDAYDGTKTDGNVGCGLFGLGLVHDTGGNDRYQVSNGGIGFGLYGTGMVIDEAGDDLYEAKKGWAQGAAYAGVGLLLDRAGNDRYRTICMSMGFGGTRGIGALVDVAGDDDYYTADTGNESKAWGKTVSMCLGCGYGRRCDSGDGQNQGGGFGIVIEGAGDDKYHTSVFSLGSGYWWGAGIFEERGGNDVYRCTHYCLGSGAHFAIGSFVDLSGDDRYNDRPDAVERWGAIGRDGSVAICIDGDGDDVWGNLTGGHADLDSIAVFWDRRGDDAYKRMQPFDPAQMGNRPFGSAAPYPPMRNFRDRLMSVGVFLDTGGKDVYPAGMTAAEESSWHLQTGPLFWGYGYDGNWSER